MKLGIFAKTYQRATVEAVFAVCIGDGLPVVQFNFVSAGLVPMPERIGASAVTHIRAAADKAGVEISTISATFNMIHPDPAVRTHGLELLEVIAAVAGDLGATTLSLCTGSRDPENMWHAHPRNDAPDAWTDIVASMHKAVAIADKYDLGLAMEPEPGNVIKNAQRAKKLLDEIGSDRLGIILDPANLIEGVPTTRHAAVITEAIDLLAARTVMLHGKDRDAQGAVQAPGAGIVPWSSFLQQVLATGYDGPLILHGFPESAVPAAVNYLRGVLGDPGSTESAQ
ncbi:MAG TPA: sugar phosphate isomerase/epimerase [Thermomicrobiales bacterium]|nr:sugar phosphate isomerase/epimerase [Thermomicrobiales bacterium]